MGKYYGYKFGLVGLIGFLLSGYIVDRYGEYSRVIMGTILLSIVLISLFILILKKQFYQSITVAILVLPIIVMQVGSFLNNNALGVIGFILLIFGIIIINTILPKYKKD